MHDPLLKRDVYLVAPELFDNFSRMRLAIPELLYTLEV